MKTTILLLASALAIAPVNAIQREGNVITLTDEEAAACEAGGGCVVAPKAEIQRVLLEVHTRTLQGCKDRT